MGGEGGLEDYSWKAFQNEAAGLFAGADRLDTNQSARQMETNRRRLYCDGAGAHWGSSSVIRGKVRRTRGAPGRSPGQTGVPIRSRGPQMLLCRFTDVVPGGALRMGNAARAVQRRIAGRMRVGARAAIDMKSKWRDRPGLLDDLR